MRRERIDEEGVEEVFGKDIVLLLSAYEQHRHDKVSNFFLPSLSPWFDCGIPTSSFGTALSAFLYGIACTFLHGTKSYSNR